MSAARGPILAKPLGLASFVVFIAVGARWYLSTALHGWGIAEATLLPRMLYSRTVITPTYFDLGFVRRGLGGTIARLLSPDFIVSGVMFDLVSLVFLASALGYLVYRVARTASISRAIYLALLLAISPQAFIGWSHDPARTDVIAAGFIAWAVIALLHDRRMTALVILIAGSLAHETVIVFGAALGAVLLVTEYHAGRLDRRAAGRLTVIFAGGLAAVLLAQKLFSAPPAVVADYMLSHSIPGASGPEEMSREVAVYMAVAGARGVATAVCSNLHYDPFYYYTGLCALIVLAVYASLLGLISRPAAFAVAVFAPFLFMMLIANDTGRWLKLAVVNAWLLTAAFHIRQAGPYAMRLRPMAFGLATMLLLLVLGSSRYNTVNNASHLLGLRLGLADPGSLEGWMARCDPQWRTVVYGSKAKAQARPAPSTATSPSPAGNAFADRGAERIAATASTRR